MSNSLKDMLAAKQKEMAAKAAEGAGVKDATSSKEMDSSASASQATGMQSSAAQVKSLPTVAVQKKEINEELAKDAVAVFEDTRPLRQVMKAKGGILKAVNGFFYAKDEEESTLLYDYASRNQCKVVE